MDQETRATAYQGDADTAQEKIQHGLEESSGNEYCHRRKHESDTVVHGGRFPTSVV